MAGHSRSLPLCFLLQSKRAQECYACVVCARSKFKTYKPHTQGTESLSCFCFGNFRKMILGLRTQVRHGLWSCPGVQGAHKMARRCRGRRHMGTHHCQKEKTDARGKEKCGCMVEWTSSLVMKDICFGTSAHLTRINTWGLFGLGDLGYSQNKKKTQRSFICLMQNRNSTKRVLSWHVVDSFAERFAIIWELV